MVHESLKSTAMFQTYDLLLESTPVASQDSIFTYHIKPTLALFTLLIHVLGLHLNSIDCHYRENKCTSVTLKLEKKTIIPIKSNPFLFPVCLSSLVEYE